MKLPSSLNEIGISAFKYCELLEQIIIPSSVEVIYYSAFDECTSLKQVIFEEPSFVTYIADRAFYHCSSLTEISLPLV